MQKFSASTLQKTKRTADEVSYDFFFSLSSILICLVAIFNYLILKLNMHNYEFISGNTYPIAAVLSKMWGLSPTFKEI